MLDAIIALALAIAPAFADPTAALEFHARAAVERMAPCRAPVVQWGTPVAQTRAPGGAQQGAKPERLAHSLVDAASQHGAAGGPIQVERAACLRDHRAVAHAIALAAESEADAVALIGLCAHESGCRDVDQMGGPAFGPWQCEPPRQLRASLRVDMLAQARWALRAWHHGARTYACGGGDCERAAGELRAYVASAAYAWAVTR